VKKNIPFKFAGKLSESPYGFRTSSIYIFFVNFGAHVSHECIRYIQSEQPGFPVFPFQLRIIISMLRAWENIARWPALYIHVATLVCLYHHHIHMALSVKFGAIVICNNKNNNNTTVGTYANNNIIINDKGKPNYTRGCIDNIIIIVVACGFCFVYLRSTYIYM